MGISCLIDRPNQSINRLDRVRKEQANHRARLGDVGIQEFRATPFREENPKPAHRAGRGSCALDTDVAKTAFFCTRERSKEVIIPKSL